jgi:hypothetical protein
MFNIACLIEATIDNDWYELVILVVIPKRKIMRLRKGLQNEESTDGS